MRETVYVETPAQALEIWALYRREGVEVHRRMGPRTLGRVSPLKGLEVPHAVALLVEETEGFLAAESSIRAQFGLDEPVREWKGAPLSPDEFQSRLAFGLPREFRPPHEELCEVEFEEMAREAEQKALEGIEKKYRSRYPKLMRDGFEAGWNGASML